MRKKINRIARIIHILKVIIVYKIKGYPYYTAKKWGRKVYEDLTRDNGISKKEKKWAHNRGFLSSSIEKYDLTEETYKNYLSDFEYYCLYPINNAYQKWLRDRLTPFMILQKFRNVMPEIYCNIIRREDEQVYIPTDETLNICSRYDLLDAIKMKGSAMLLPSDTYRSKFSYKIEYKDSQLYINGENISEEALLSLLEKMTQYYILRENVESTKEIQDMFGTKETEFIFVVCNSQFNKADILCAYAEIKESYNCGLDVSKRSVKAKQILINDLTGFFSTVLYGKEHQGTIPRWNEISEIVCEVAEYISEIEYMSIGVKISDNGIKITRFGVMPRLPENIFPESPLNLFLKERARKKIQELKQYKTPVKKQLKKYVVRFLKKHYFKRGFREYMLAVWLNTVKDDLKTDFTTIREKMWAWHRGFPSYRIAQYNLTDENWDKILSDYQYAWLNRINNVYQKWINDKLTLRYVLDSYKEYLAEYYFYVGRRNGSVHIKKLQDCPEEIDESISGIIDILKAKGKLVFKPNAGTHGDGFYKIEYRKPFILINDSKSSEEDLIKILSSQKSTYVVTDYLEMHSHLKKIYPGAVNTVRIMVINRNCTEPKIMQTYLRVGTSKTGVTDNIAYGGIAIYVDKDSGFYDRAGLLKNHQYQSIKFHPDTGTLLEGYLPNWDIVKSGVYKIANSMPQLEYLGFDVVITEEGFKILEINIHQDIHKAHEFDKPINDFFISKIAYKEKVNERKGA